MSHPLATPLPTFAATRLAAHRLAVYVVSPARRRATGRIGLRAGAGAVYVTPPFDGQAVRLEPAALVRDVGGAREEVPVTTLRDAAAFLLGGAPDVEYATDFDVPPPGGLDDALAYDPAAAEQLGAWYRFGFDVLGTMREGAAEVQLWPEHFDAAVDAPLGEGRITFGASPGDATSDEPYLYVLPPGPVERGEVWNAAGFTGAVLPLSAFVDADDQRTAALGFLRSRWDAAAAA
ncbi:MAG TPA: hypothetical protein VL422_14550 [Miltoncostaea sp.]|nr:hypothetical protein [Miltoncostaea sp.]